jgi:hypothetical protein
MSTRARTATFAGALFLGALVGCGDGSTGSTGSLGSYQPGGWGEPGNTNNNQSSSGSGSSSGGNTSSSGGTTTTNTSSGGTTPTGSSSGGTSPTGSGSGGTAVVDAGPPPPPPLTAQEALTQVGACMQLSQFTSNQQFGAAAADIAKATVITGGGGNCMGCHNVGDNGFWASYGTQGGINLTQQMFTQTQQMPYILKWFAPTVDQNGNFKDVVASNAIVDQEAAAASCTTQNGAGCHPKFQLNPNLVSAMNAFVTTTLMMWHSNSCAARPPGDAGVADASAD